jgi:hypothetical protein
MGSQGYAADDGSTATLDYHHYAEGERDLEGRTYKSLNLRPIEVDSLALAVRNTLADRWRFALNYTQDTWSGATPVLSLPQAAINEQLVSGASVPLVYLTDSKHRPQDVDPGSFDGQNFKSTEDQRLVHLMASASPETRRQVDGRARLRLGPRLVRAWAAACRKNPIITRASSTPAAASTSITSAPR